MGGSTRLPDQRGWKRRRRFLLWLKSLRGTDWGVTGSLGTTAVQSEPQGCLQHPQRLPRTRRKWPRGGWSGLGKDFIWTKVSTRS